MKTFRESSAKIPEVFCKTQKDEVLDKSSQAGSPGATHGVFSNCSHANSDTVLKSSDDHTRAHKHVTCLKKRPGHTVQL